jgi:tetratricopeptide (TPR) repeat protein
MTYTSLTLLRISRFSLGIIAVGYCLSSAMSANAQVEASFELQDYDFWSEQCLQLTQNRQYTDALTACETAISLKPKRDNIELWIGRSDALFHLARYAESLTSYTHVIELAPRSSVAIAYQCATLFQLNRYNDAIDSCEQALRIDGDWGQESPGLAFFYRGLALRKLGRLETARASYEQSLRLNPEDASANAEWCSLSLELGTAAATAGRNCQEINQAYAQALTQDASNVALWIQQGLTLEQLGSHAGALTAYNQALNLNPQNTIALAYRCGVLNALEQYQPALESCEQALKLEQPNAIATAFLWSQHSAALVGVGQAETALASAEQAIAIRPDYALGWNSQAVSLWHLARYEEAGAAIEQAIDAYQKSEAALDEKFQRDYPDPPLIFYRGIMVAYFNQGRILGSLGQAQKHWRTAENYWKAINAYNAALSISRLFSINDQIILSNIYANIASMYLQLSELDATSNQDGNLSLALQAANRATDQNPNSFAGWYNRGLAKLKLGSYFSSQNDFERADQLNPNNLYVLTGRGMALLNLEEFEEAIASFNQALSIDPNYELAQNQRELAIQTQFQQGDEPNKLPDP